MTMGTLAIAPLTFVSPGQPTGLASGPLGIAALISWLLTAGIGAYMLRTWIARGGLRRQRATGVGAPPAVVFGHPGAALTGLVVWIGYLGSRWDALAWLGVVLISAAITLGICMVTLWTPYPVRAEPKTESEAPFAAASQPARPEATFGAAGQGPQAAAAQQPDAFTVTDEMIAQLLAEPSSVRRRRRLQLLPLIPACHGFAAMATFLLATLTAVSAVRLGARTRIRTVRRPPIGRFAEASGRLESWQKP
jgi:hypothetical protein